MPLRAPRFLAPLLAVVALAGCGGSGSSSPALPTGEAARTYELADFTPRGAVAPGKPVTISFGIRQPDGRMLTNYRRGAGPHTGVHLIVVARDLSTIIHRHPPIGADGRLDE